jgi:RNA polymerase sigma factor (sigma-70 family)
MLSEPNTLQNYLRSISDIPLLNFTEEKQLACIIATSTSAAATDADKAEGETAIHTIVNHNLKLVIYLARKICSGNDPIFLDLVAGGNMGLIRAAARFKPQAQGVRFAAFARFYIFDALNQEKRHHTHPLSAPVQKLALARELTRVIKQYEEDNEGKSPSNDTLAQILNTSPITIGHARVLTTPPVYLDQSLGDREDDRYSTLTVASDAPTHEGGTLDTALSKLKPREAYIVAASFGLNGGGEHTNAEIGRKLGITRERVRQILLRSMSQLKQALTGSFKHCT